MSLELKQMVLRAIRKTIQNKLDMNSEFKKALLEGDQGKAYIQNMANNLTLQIKSTPNWIFIDQFTIHGIVSDFTNVFINGMERKAGRKAALENEAMVEAAAKKYEWMDENGNGTDPETGIQIVDKTVTNGPAS